MTIAIYTPVVRQQIEVESELQSLQARLDDMTDKYSRAMADRDKVDSSAPLHDIRVRVYLAIKAAAFLLIAGMRNPLRDKGGGGRYL